jgi:hypothetical protein
MRSSQSGRVASLRSRPSEAELNLSGGTTDNCGAVMPLLTLRADNCRRGGCLPKPPPQHRVVSPHLADEQHLPVSVVQACKAREIPPHALTATLLLRSAPVDPE